MKTARTAGPARWPGRSTSRAGARAMLLALGCAFAPLGASMASDPKMPPAHLSPPSVNWSQDRLADYAAAAAAVEAEVKAFVRQYARAQRHRNKAAIISANEEATRRAIRVAGLTLAEFDAIQRVVHGDPRLHAQVREIQRHE